MQPRHQVSAAAIELIKGFEGLRRSAAQLPDGRWTVGYGHTRSAREGARIGEDDANALLLFDLAEVCVVLNETIFTPLTQNQFDALVSFAMNIGIDNFRTSSVLLRINEGSLLQAAAALELWRKADFEGERIVVDALVRRRAAEKALFLTPADGFVPTPSPVVRPKLDQAGVVGPDGAAVELTAPLDGPNAAAVRETGGPLDETPSPTELAAASVSARLQAILSDLDLPQQPIGPTQQQEDTAADAQAVHAEPPAFEQPAQEAAPSDPEEWTARLGPAPIEEVDPDLFDRTRFRASEASGDEDFNASRMARARAGFLLLALMVVIGLSLLAGATFWLVAAHPHMNGVTPSVVGWVLGLTGIGLLASSIYLLLERIGARDDAD